LYLTALFKLVIAPLSTVLMLLVLQLCGFPLSTPLMAGIFIATAVSSAASASAMAKKYGVDGEYAAILTLGTTILCAVSLPLLYMLSAVILGW
jgi:predicted permease